MFDWSKTAENVSAGFKQGVDIIDQMVEDKDLAKKLNQQLYLVELSTKTVPVIDAIHKMGRQIISLLTLIIPAILVYHDPTIEPMTLAAIAGPSGIYNYIKGKGK